MEIACSKCLYIMPKSQAIGYFGAEVFSLYREVHQDILNLKKLIRTDFKTESQLHRGVIKTLEESVFNILIAFLNHLEIKCFECRDFTGWKAIFVKDNSINYNKTTFFQENQL